MHPAIPVLLGSLVLLQAAHPAGLDGLSQQSAAPDLLTRLAKSPGQTAETRHLRLTTSTSSSSTAPGSTLTLVVAIAPRPGMHVYAPEQKDLIPIALVLKPDPAIRIGARRLPPSEAYVFAPLNETQRVYSRPFRIEQDVQVLDTPAVKRRAAASGASLTITGHLRYQACDDAVCYLPQEVPVSWTVPLGLR